MHVKSEATADWALSLLYTLLRMEGCFLGSWVCVTGARTARMAVWSERPKVAWVDMLSHSCWSILAGPHTRSIRVRTVADSRGVIEDGGLCVSIACDAAWRVAYVDGGVGDAVGIHAYDSVPCKQPPMPKLREEHSSGYGLDGCVQARKRVREGLQTVDHSQSTVEVRAVR
eukprot:806081-Prymnesium_polylepis.2